MTPYSQRKLLGRTRRKGSRVGKGYGMMHFQFAMKCPACAGDDTALVSTAVRDGQRVGYMPVCLNCDFEGPVAATKEEARAAWTVTAQHAAE